MLIRREWRYLTGPHPTATTPSFICYSCYSFYFYYFTPAVTRFTPVTHFTPATSIPAVTHFTSIPAVSHYTPATSIPTGTPFTPATCTHDVTPFTSATFTPASSTPASSTPAITPFTPALTTLSTGEQLKCLWRAGKWLFREDSRIIKCARGRLVMYSVIIGERLHFCDLENLFLHFPAAH